MLSISSIRSGEREKINCYGPLMARESPDPFSVAGRRAVIVGGTAGIGSAVARHLREAGAEVVITGRRDDGGDVADRIGAVFVRMDVADDASVSAGFETIADAGAVDCLVLNAGIDEEHGEVGDLDLEVFARVLDINTMGLVRAMARGVGLMGSGGSVIVTSSPAGSTTTPGMAAYSASKAALDMLVRTWALERGPKGLRVNAVLPGIVEGELDREVSPARQLNRRMAGPGGL